MNDLLIRWLAALRSGNFKQGRSYLRKGEHYCCLGVACEVLDIKKIDKSDLVIEYDDIGVTVPNNKLLIRFGFSTKIMREQRFIIKGQDFYHTGSLVNLLMGLNDDMKLTFEEIADFIEINYDRLKT